MHVVYISVFLQRTVLSFGSCWCSLLSALREDMDGVATADASAGEERCTCFYLLVGFEDMHGKIE